MSILKVLRCLWWCFIRHSRVIWLCTLCSLFASHFGVWAQSNAEPGLIVGISAKSFPDVSEADIEVTIKLLAEEFGKSSGYETVVTAYTDEDLLRHDFEQGKINFVVSSSLILATQYEKSLLGNGFRFLRDTQSPDQLLIVGRAEYDLLQFRGKRAVLAQNDPVAELYLDYFSLKTFEQEYKSSFKVLPQVAKVNQLLLKVFFGEADLTSVYQNFYQTALEMNPQLAGKLKVLAHIDNIPPAGNFFRKGTPSEFQEKVIQQALIMTHNPRGLQLLEMFRSNRIVRSSPDDILPAQQLYSARQRVLNGR